MKNQVITNQLNLFDTPPPDYDEILNTKANHLLDMLNEDRKIKYEPQYTTQEKDLIILIVANKEKDILYNVLNIYGETPKGFSVNWRNAEHIKQEISQYKN